jgi:predicted ester cyclase
LNRKGENARLMQQWFTEGWAGNEALADHVFSDRFRDNGVIVGPAAPKRNPINRLAGFPDPSSVVEDTLAVKDTVILRLRWAGTHTGPYLGVSPTGKQVQVRGITIWRFETGKAVETGPSVISP